MEGPQCQDGWEGVDKEGFPGGGGVGVDKCLRRKMIKLCHPWEDDGARLRRWGNETVQPVVH